MREIVAALLIAAPVAAATGCGSSDSSGPPPAPPPSETAQKLPKLPHGWKAHRDRSVGYAIGVAPGWKLDSHGGKVLIRSPDHLVAVTLAVDRNGDALELAPGQFATRALAALPGFRSQLVPSKPKPFGGTPLKGVQVTATGATKPGRIPERVTLIVLRRGQIVNYTVAVVENRQRAASKLDRSYALRMVKTLRDQPVQAQSAPGSL
jgi:hypothetical protein